MFIVFYQKSDSVIKGMRHHLSTGDAPTPDQWLDVFCKDNKVSAADFGVAQINPPPANPAVVDTKIYNVSTGLIEVNPDYTPPAPNQSEPLPITRE
jgi:hypothetical protein